MKPATFKAALKDWAPTRAVLGAGLELQGRVSRNAREIYGGRPGLRIATLHDVAGTRDRARFRRLVERCREAFEPASPDDIEAAPGGGEGGRDSLLFTFDDGFAGNLEAARYLAERGWRAIFFVIPSFLDRDLASYRDFHRAQGVEPFLPVSRHDRALTRAEVREMAAMGHRIAAHNYGHRDLGRLRERDELDYEIGRALAEVSELTGSECRDFAWGFGHPQHLSVEAWAYLKAREVRTYSCVRGKNVPGLTPRILLRDNVSLAHPSGYSLLVLRGGLDHRYVGERADLTSLSGTRGP